jgi:hypothetical protein
MDAVAIGSVPDVWSDCTAGLVAGALAAALTTPFDVLVTHTATAHADGSSRSKRSRGSSSSSGGGDGSSSTRPNDASDAEERFALWDTIVEPLRVGARLVECEGPRSLVKGMGMRTLYYAPTVGCFFALYEQFRRMLGEALGLGDEALGLGGEVLGELPSVPANLPADLEIGLSIELLYDLAGAALLDAAGAAAGAALDASSLPIGEAVGGVVGPILESVSGVL